MGPSEMAELIGRTQLSFSQGLLQGSLGDPLFMLIQGTMKCILKKINWITLLWEGYRNCKPAMIMVQKMLCPVFPSWCAWCGALLLHTSLVLSLPVALLLTLFLSFSPPNPPTPSVCFLKNCIMHAVCRAGIILNTDFPIGWPAFLTGALHSSGACESCYTQNRPELPGSV